MQQVWLFGPHIFLCKYCAGMQTSSSKTTDVMCSPLWCDLLPLHSQPSERTSPEQCSVLLIAQGHGALSACSCVYGRNAERRCTT